MHTFFRSCHCDMWRSVVLLTLYRSVVLADLVLVSCFSDRKCSNMIHLQQETTVVSEPWPLMSGHHGYNHKNLPMTLTCYQWFPVGSTLTLLSVTSSWSDLDFVICDLHLERPWLCYVTSTWSDLDFVICDLHLERAVMVNVHVRTYLYLCAENCVCYYMAYIPLCMWALDWLIATVYNIPLWRYVM